MSQLNIAEEIEQLFLGDWAHTITIEYMAGEDQILITIEGITGSIVQMSCDWAAGEHLEEVLIAAIHRAIP